MVQRLTKLVYTFVRSYWIWQGLFQIPRFIFIQRVDFPKFKYSWSAAFLIQAAFYNKNMFWRIKGHWPL